nr:Proton pump interactor 1 isoform 3 [Ipomoea trifida]
MNESSSYVVNTMIKSLQYRIQHESITPNEEKQILREIKQIEGTREKVIANAAERAKIQESLGEKESIQSQVTVDKFVAQWSSNKSFRDDYEKRILQSLDMRHLSKDGRMRNPDEEPLVLPGTPNVPALEVVVKTTQKASKEDSAPPPQPDASLRKLRKTRTASSRKAGRRNPQRIP